MMVGPRLGVQAHELEDEGLASYFGAKKGAGLLVLSVDDESVAGKAGIKPGDIINRSATTRSRTPRTCVTRSGITTRATRSTLR
jgi:hypothetical protein